MNDPMSDIFLSWGSSVNLNEDLRRTIRVEIDEIESSISSLQTNVQGEEKIATQLIKDLSHAKTEISNLRRGAADDLDNAIINEQIRSRLGETLKNEVIAVVVSPSNSSIEFDSDSADRSETPALQDNMNDNPNDQDHPYIHKIGQRKESLATYLSQNNENVTKLSKIIKDEVQSIQEIQEKGRLVENEENMILRRIRDDDLINAAAVVEREVVAKKREKETEKIRVFNLKETIQRSRKRCGDFAREIAENSRKLSVERNGNLASERKMESKIDNIQADIQNVESTKLAAMNDILTSLSAQHNNLIQQFAERDTINESVLEKVTEREKLESECKILTNKEEELKNKVRDSTTHLESSKVNLKTLQDEKKSLIELIMKNEREEKEILEPALNERMKISKIKEDLAKKISNSHERNVAMKEQYQQSLDNNKKLVQSEELEINRMNSEVEKLKGEIESLEKQVEDIRTNEERTIKEHEAYKKKFEDATKAEEMNIQRGKEKYENLKNEKMKKIKDDHTLVHDSLLFKLAVLEEGLKIINSTEVEEKELNAKPIDINEECSLHDNVEEGQSKDDVFTSYPTEHSTNPSISQKEKLSEDKAKKFTAEIDIGTATSSEDVSETNTNSQHVAADAHNNKKAPVRRSNRQRSTRSNSN